MYVADGAGSGSWASIGTSAFTGMIADFASPVAPTGWLELDGSVISTSTYSGLFAVMSITSSGTRTNGNAVVTSIPDTSSFKAGYYVFGTGISAGTTILTVDSSTQITMSGTAGSSGTSSFFVSPWPMNTGTVTLPDLTTAGRYRRSRTSATKVGDTLADQNKAHTHTGATGTESATHTHAQQGTFTSGTESADHTHTYNQGISAGITSDITAGSVLGGSFSAANTGGKSATHTHNTTISGQTGNASATHTHTISSDGGTEARPLTLVVMTCIKT